MRTSFRALQDNFSEIPASFLHEVAPRYRDEDYVRDAFATWFDECHGPINVAGCELWPSFVLRMCDPAAYHKEFMFYLCDYNELWVETAEGFLECSEVADIVDAWQMLPETEQNKYLNDCGCGGCDDCNEEEE